MITLSPQLSLVPFANHNDGNRLHMSASQLRQALPLVYGEPPLVITGYEPLFVTVNRTVDFDGVVVFVHRRVIVIRNKETGKYEIIRLARTDLPIVSVGDEVSRGTIVAVPEGYTSKTVLNDYYYSFGINVYTGILNHPYGFEDAYVISEELKNKYASFIPEVKSIILERDEFLLPLDEAGNLLPPLNTPIKGPILIVSNFNLRKKVIEIPFEVIVDYVQVSVNKKLPLQEDLPPYFKGFLARKLKEARELYEQVMKVSDEETANKVYQVLALEGTHAKDSKNWNCVITIYFKKIQRALDYGDKITNRHAGKGVVSHYSSSLPLVVPDNKKVDLLLNPMSIISRMNFGTFMELLASRVVLWLKNKVEECAKNGDLNCVTNTLINFYRFVDRTPGQVFYNQVAGLINTVLSKADRENAAAILSKIDWQFPATPFYSVSLEELKQIARKFIPSLKVNRKRLKESTKQYGEFSEKLLEKITREKPYEDIYITIDEDGDIFIDPLISIANNQEKTLTLINSGYLYYIKLIHLSKLKLSARSVGELSMKNLQPKKVKKSFVTQESEYYYGYERDEIVETSDIIETFDGEDEYFIFANTPQRVGEMETFCLISYDVIDYLRELLVQSEDIKGKLNLVLSLLFNLPYNYRDEKNDIVQNYLKVLNLS